MSLYNISALFRAECFKMKYNKGILLIFLFPIVITAITASYIIYKSKDILEPILYDPWIGILGRYLFSIYAFLFPLIIAISCYSLCETEYKNKSLKQLFTFPALKSEIFIAKITLLTSLIFFTVLIAYAIFLLSGYLVNYIFPVYNFLDYNIMQVAAVYFSKIFITALSIAAIQYFLGLAFENFVIPIGFASFFTIMSLIANKWEYIGYLPYYSFYYAFNSYMTSNEILITIIELINIGYIFIFISLSYLVFVTKKV